jgi:hypothetical protein
MRKWNEEGVFVAWLAGVLLAGLVACQSIGGRTTHVEFRSSEGLQSGDRVYLAGVEIGTADEAAVVAGVSSVPVQLYRRHKDAVPPGTVFLLTSDEHRPPHKCLIGFGAALAAKADPSKTTFKGASNWIELAALIGQDKIDRLRNQLLK